VNQSCQGDLPSRAMGSPPKGAIRRSPAYRGTAWSSNQRVTTWHNATWSPPS